MNYWVRKWCLNLFSYHIDMCKRNHLLLVALTYQMISSYHYWMDTSSTQSSRSLSFIIQSSEFLWHQLHTRENLKMISISAARLLTFEIVAIFWHLDQLKYFRHHLRGLFLWNHILVRMFSPFTVTLHCNEIRLLDWEKKHNKKPCWVTPLGHGQIMFLLFIICYNGFQVRTTDVYMAGTIAHSAIFYRKAIIRENHHASVVWNWYHWVTIAYLYQPSP